MIILVCQSLCLNLLLCWIKAGQFCMKIIVKSKLKSSDESETSFANDWYCFIHNIAQEWFKTREDIILNSAYVKWVRSETGIVSGSILVWLMFRLKLIQIQNVFASLAFDFKTGKLKTLWLLISKYYTICWFVSIKYTVVSSVLV